MNFNTGTREYIESIFNGQTPVEREHPLAGQSKYFYFKPGQRDDISVSDMETVDVPTADTPNPFLNGTSSQSSFAQSHLSSTPFGNTNDYNGTNIQSMFNGQNAGISDDYNPITLIYNLEQRVGEFAADTKLAYDYWRKMKRAGNRLVNTLGPGQGADIDNYYHPLLQCELAKISPQSRDNGIALGYAKEGWDYLYKRFLQRQAHDKIVIDSRKDLQNNLYGSNLGYNNPNVSCEDLLDDRRTPNMRKLGIR